MNVTNLDLIVIILYFILVLGVGLWAGMKGRGRGESAGYFLAGGTLTWPIIGLALFSTNISTIHLVSLAQEGFMNGLAYGNMEWMAPFTLIALSLFFAPFYLRSRVTTLPDFLEKRYSRACRDWLAVMGIVSAIFIHIGFTLYTGAVVLHGLFNIPILWSIVGVLLVTGTYTVIGGLRAVVFAEALQTIILLGGAFLLTAIGYIKVGGWSGIAANVPAVNLTILRPWNDPSNLPWPAVFLGYPIIGLWYWCADQTIVQRVLGAKDENHARVGPLFAGFLKILTVFLFVLPGVICLALIQQNKLPPLPGGDTKGVYSHMIMHVLPPGIRSIMAAALLAALMGTTSGALNSIATLFSYDLYKRWRPETPDHKLVAIGRIVTLVGMILAMAWSTQLGRFQSIFQGIVEVICDISPPITAVFVWGVFWRRASSRAALTTLVVGSALGITVFLLGWFKDYTHWDVPPMMATFYLFVICSIIMVVESLLNPHQHTAESEKLVWNSLRQALTFEQAWKGIGNFKFLAGLLFVIMVTLYVIFR
jgi:solute:Na+ symporter, SSS family